MARRNVFENVMKAIDAAPENAGAVNPPSPAKYGAAKSISSSIDELARHANRIILSENIVDIDPALIESSFVADRMDETSPEGDQSFNELLRAIRERGQDTPVLLRPMPNQLGRFQIVFGHRRVRAARELNRPVKAVVKSLQDIDLVLAQGQENAARSNLSFIERVLFANRLSEMGYARDVIQSALAVDYQTLSKMLTIPKAIPAALIDAIGPAKGVGRDRWLELRKLLERPGRAEAALERISEADFAPLNSEERFAALFSSASRDLTVANPTKVSSVKIKKAIARPVVDWVSADKAIAAKISRAGSSLTLVLKSPKAVKSETGDFGDYVSSQLADLYEKFRAGHKPGSKAQSGD